MDNEITERVEHVLSTARSVRKKLDFTRPVSREDLEACINVAVQAPTGLAGENWRFLVVTDPVIKKQIAEIYCDVLVQIGETQGVTLKPTHNALMARLHEIPCMVFVFAIGEPTEDVSGQIGFFWLHPASCLVIDAGHAGKGNRHHLDVLAHFAQRRHRQNTEYS